jgi:hypothetical protein
MISRFTVTIGSLKGLDGVESVDAATPALKPSWKSADDATPARSRASTVASVESGRPRLASAGSLTLNKFSQLNARDRRAYSRLVPRQQGDLALADAGVVGSPRRSSSVSFSEEEKYGVTEMIHRLVQGSFPDATMLSNFLAAYQLLMPPSEIWQHLMERSENYDLY